MFSNVTSAEHRLRRHASDAHNSAKTKNVLEAITLRIMSGSLCEQRAQTRPVQMFIVLMTSVQIFDSKGRALSPTAASLAQEDSVESLSSRSV